MDPNLPSIPLREVQRHNKRNDCWIVIKDLVYNVTDFMHSHPGGFDIFVENAGLDATKGFLEAKHTSSAFNEMKKHVIGRLDRMNGSKDSKLAILIIKNHKIINHVVHMFIVIVLSSLMLKMFFPKHDPNEEGR